MTSDILESVLLPPYMADFLSKWNNYYTIILIVVIIVLYLISKYSKSKTIRNRVSLNIFLFFLVLITIYISINLHLEWWPNSTDENLLSKLKNFMALTILIFTASGGVSIISFFIYLTDENAYHLNQKLIDRNKQIAIRQNNKEVGSSKKKIELINNIISAIGSKYKLYIINKKTLENDVFISSFLKEENSPVIFKIQNTNYYFIFDIKTIPLYDIPGGNREYRFTTIDAQAKTNTTWVIKSIIIHHPSKEEERIIKTFDEISLGRAPSIPFLLEHLNNKTQEEEEIIQELLISNERNHIKIYDFYYHNLLELMSTKHNFLIPISIPARLNHLLIAFIKFYILGFFVKLIINSST